ncbi:hypothetical protein BX600DRAFT_61785 [Xylariales sp. PMI_506]|nr:hypothetical protein BX600DRAFT_61785 [Xylariales sp. PMI_506]
MASPTAAVLGGIPTVSIDVPICSVLLALYATGSALNATIFFVNRRRGHKFFISWFLNVFCIIRIVTCSMRIAWAKSPTNSHLAIAAQVFNSAGILFIYIINLIFAQRILRARQPKIGWSKLLAVSLKIMFGLIFGTLIMAITVLVISINTTNPHTLQAIRDVGLAAATFITVMAVLPAVLLAAAFLWPASKDAENFGAGSMRAKVLIVSVACCLAVISAGFKCGTTWKPPRLASDPAWYDLRPAFYCFTFLMEILILALFLVTRVDKRFHVPNGCKAPGDYTRLGPNAEEDGDESSPQEK